MLALAVSASLPSAAGAQPDNDLIKGPIVITSATLSADSVANTAVFEGSVVAKTDKVTLQADRMTVYYTKDGSIQRIDVDGNVKLIKNDGGVLTSDKAVYTTIDEKVTFTGSPMAQSTGSIITGSEIVYLIEEDRSVVKDSKVFIEQERRR